MTELDAGAVLDDAGSLFMVLQGTVLVETKRESYERGPGAVVGYVEAGFRLTAVTDVRVVVVTRADYEAALSG